jgi:hypothetical protein
LALSGASIRIATAETPRASVASNLNVTSVIVSATPATKMEFNPAIDRPYICLGAPESPALTASVYDDLAPGSPVTIRTSDALTQTPPVTYVDDLGVTKYVSCTDLSLKWPHARLSTNRVRVEIEFGSLDHGAAAVTCELFRLRYGERVCVAPRTSGVVTVACISLA